VKKIKLTQGKFALVDNEDYEWLNNFKWCLYSNLYAKRGHTVKKGVYKTLLMHREILEKHQIKIPKNLQVDHKNHNGLDNRKINLRLVTKTQNQFNSVKQVNNTSGYKGVSWDKNRNKWSSAIMIEGKFIHLGRYKELWIAKLARKWAEKLYQGEYRYENIGCPQV